MVELKLIEIESLYKFLLSDELTSKHLPAKVSYYLAVLKDKIKPFLEKYEEQRLEIIKKYGEIVDNSFSIPDENAKIYTDEMLALNNFNEEIQIGTLSISDFYNLDFSIGFMEKLFKFIKD